ncbi:C40 family peptidase [Nonomuraea lactucae]|uniref:C40 family peptidase n=1 Tax=Nonomuraea lactucae TaxID=2249762 RepID=UPI000DE38065|nr:C40 family peptidase [Nonomuraea lactucae]
MRTVRAGAAACLILALCSPAHADPGPSKRDVRDARHAVRERTERLSTASAALATAQSRLDDLTAGVERLVEAYNGELVQLEHAKQSYEQARARLVAADAEAERARQAVAVVAAEVYSGYDLSRPFLVMFNDVGGTDGYLHRVSVLEQLGAERARILTRMRDAKRVSSILRAQAAGAYAEQQAASERARLAKIAAERAVAGQRRETRLLERERDALEERVDAARSRAERLAREREEAREARLRRLSALGGYAGSLAAKGSLSGDLAANWALTQLGKPYVWAADGPSSYDCSGLTMRAWERAGVRLDHWTGTQWTSGPHVPIDELRRGDLLFFGHISDDPGTIHHVGIYVGQGMMVHAPQTGDVVRVAPIWRSDLVGATRPA